MKIHVFDGNIHSALIAGVTKFVLTMLTQACGKKKEKQEGWQCESYNKSHRYIEEQSMYNLTSVKFNFRCLHFNIIITYASTPLAGRQFDGVCKNIYNITFIK